MPAPVGKSLPIGFNSKFALLAISNVHSTLPGQGVQLSDGTSVLPGIPTEHLGVWREWIGTIRVRRLEAANVVLLIDTIVPTHLFSMPNICNSVTVFREFST